MGISFFSQSAKRRTLFARRRGGGKGNVGEEERPIRAEIEGAKLISISGRGAARTSSESPHVQFPSTWCRRAYGSVLHWCLDCERVMTPALHLRATATRT